jgi:hypothetical protein
VPVYGVARDVKVNRKTVAARLEKMTDAGFWVPLTLGLKPVRVSLVRAKVLLERA